jgi:hypothetical protein
MWEMGIKIQNVFFLFLLVGLGFELRALHLQGGILCHTSSPFCSGYFGGGGGVL